MSRYRIVGLRTCILVALIAAASQGARAGEASDDVSGLVAAVAGPDAHAEHDASLRLVALGDPAVPALAKLAGANGALEPRLVAVELLGKIGTGAARDALLALLALLKAEKNLAVRGQLCMQLGEAHETRAIPVIAEWLETIGPNAINDVAGPKEVQPSTCYIRHIEALAMIGDEAAIPILEKFAKGIPPNIGYGGFLTHFVKGAVDEALQGLRDRAAFWQAVRRQPGLEQAVEPLFAYLQADRVARFRQQEDEVIRMTEQGKAVLEVLTRHKDAKVAASAKTLLDRFDALAASVKMKDEG